MAWSVKSRLNIHRILSSEVAERRCILAGMRPVKQEERRTGRLRATIRGLAGHGRVDTE